MTDSADPELAAAYLTAAGAIKSGDVDTIKRLLAEHPDLARMRAGDGRTLLHRVADWPGHFPRELEAAQALIDAGADLDARAIDPVDGETALQWAVSSNDAALAELLVTAGAAPDGIGGDGRPLAQALFYGSRECADVLVEHGATIDLEFAAGLGRMDELRGFFTADGSLTPAAGLHHPPSNEVVPPAADAGPELLEQALVYACFFGQTAAAAVLLEYGADPSTAPSGFPTQATPLHWAAGGGHLDLVELLVEHGADVAATDPEHGGTPADWAAHQGHPETAARLRELAAGPAQS